MSVFRDFLPLLLLVSLVSSAESAEGNLSAATAETEVKPRFDIWEYRVLGNTVLTPVQIETLIYPRLGKGKTIDSVEEVRQALETLYRDSGYGAVFVDIPEQDVEGGIVRLRVTEGRLDRVRVSGARYFANSQIRAAIPALTPGTVLNLPELQSELALVNRLARDRSIAPVLRAGRTPGTVDVELKVKDELPLHASVEVNDRYTSDTSKTRASINLSYDNFWQRYHSLSLQYQTAPEASSEAQVIAATYLAPLSSGNLLAVYAVDTDSEVATVGTLSVLGKGRIYGARYIVPLPESARYSHSMTFGGDFKDFEEDVRIDADQGLSTPIQYASWSMVYNGNVRTQSTTTSFNMGANLGIRGLANDAAEFESKRFKASPNYFSLRADAAHDRAFLLGTRLALRLGGQYSVEPLISNEQFSIGGAESVRGYLESESLGDYGISGTLELQSPAINRWLSPSIQQLYALLFADAGMVRVIDALKDQATGTDLSSWGAGVRFAGFGLTGSLDWAYPLRSTDGISVGDSRIHFLVRYAF